MVVVHTAEGALSYQSLGSFFANPSSEVSSQTGIDDTPGIIGEYVRRDRAAWTQANYNSASVATELCAFAKWDRAEWLRHPAMLENCRQWIAEECGANGIPLVRIGASAAQGGGAGVCGHVDLGAGGGNHWDPGPEFPWDIVLGGGTPAVPATPPGLNAAVVDLCTVGRGYAMVAADGGVFCFGCDFKGSLGSTVLNAPIVGMASSATGAGYWLAGGDGGVFAFGDAPFLGSMGHAPKPAVGIARTRSGLGYWLADVNGGVYTFGDAPFLGGLGGQHLNAPVVDIDACGLGYVLTASDGGVFCFGCDFHGSAGGSPLNQPVNAVCGTEDGTGYYLCAADGGIFAYGSAAFAGGMGGEHLNWPAVGLGLDPDGRGYWIGASDGGVFAFDAPFLGSAAK